MRYFRYKKYNKVRKNADKEYLLSLSTTERKKIIKNRHLNKILQIVGVAFFFILFFIFMYFILLILKPSNIFLKILYSILIVILFFAALIISGIIVDCTIGVLINKVDDSSPRLTKEIIQKSCESIRIYYGLKDEYLLTKCFESTNIRFVNHDVCIFKYNDEIRITTNIINGFINRHCDLGCYALKYEELKVYKDDFNNKRVTVLEFENEKFILGIKAFSYINKLLKNKKED